jgi:hypothetical protein
MSNQIAQNGQQKYYAGRGINYYPLAAPLTVAPGDGFVAIVPTYGLTQDADNLMSVTATPEKLTVIKEGVYTINLIVNYDNATDAGAHVAGRLVLQSDRGGTGFITIAEQSFNTPTFDDTFKSKFTTISTSSIYLYTADNIAALIINDTGLDNITVDPASTVFVIQKVY